MRPASLVHSGLGSEVLRKVAKTCMHMHAAMDASTKRTMQSGDAFWFLVTTRTDVPELLWYSTRTCTPSTVQAVWPHEW